MSETDNFYVFFNYLIFMTVATWADMSETNFHFLCIL